MSQYAEEYEDAELSEDLDYEYDDDDDGDDELYAEDIGEDDDEGFDTIEDYVDDDDESLAERRSQRYTRGRARYPKFRRRATPRYFRQPKSYRSVRSIRSGVIQTPAGAARVRLPKSVATRTSVNARLKEVKQEIARNTRGIKKVDSTLEKNTSIVDKKVNAVRSDLRRSNKKMQDRLQQSMMMPLLLQKTPDLESATVQAVVGGTAVGPLLDVKVTNAKFQSGDNLLPLMMMMGGMGGGGSNNMMMMALILSGGLGGK